MSTIPVLEYLAAGNRPKPEGVCVLFGDEPFLKQQALHAVKQQVLGDAADIPVANYDCEDRLPQWRDVADELSTVSLFGGGGPRLVVLEGADKFVSENRQRLEEYVARPKASGLLVLEVDDWAANTRLYKAVDQTGMQINCRPPQKSAKSKELDEAAVVQWILAWGKSRHQVALEPQAAHHLLDLTGPVFGVLDQDLAKLALFAHPGQKITAETVQQVVGGWRAKTTWDLVDAMAAGDAAEAIVQLDHLLQAGEHPLALVGSISWSLRRYAAATRIFQKAEREGKKLSLREALSQAGVRDWPFGALAGAEKRLMQLGRKRAAHLYQWLMELDLSLKGSHSQDDRARWALEQLILRLSQAATPRQPARV